MPSKKPHIKLYADEMFPIPSATYLKSKGYSVTHAYDKKFIQKEDREHLKLSKKLGMVLITIDRDYLYYNQVNLEKHPGVIVISLSSVTPPNVNKICEKLLKVVNDDNLKNSLTRVTMTKIIKTKRGIKSEKYF